MSSRRTLPPILLALLLLQGAPALADGNAPGLAIRAAAPGTKAFALHRSWLQRGADLRRRPSGELVPIGASPQLECLAEAATIGLDFDQLTVKTSSTLTIRSTTAMLGDLYLYVEELAAGTLKVADKEGPLSVSDTGYGLQLVTLRKPLGYGESVELIVSQAGKPECKPDPFLGLQTCQMTSALVYNVGGVWQPSLYDLEAGVRRCAKGTVAVTLPSTMTAALTGLDAGSKENGDGTTTHGYTTTEQGIYGLAAGALVKGATPFGDKQARTFTLAAHSGHAAGWRQAAGEIIAFHAQRYGSYDLPKIDLAEIADAGGAAYGPLSTVFIPATLWSYDPAEWSSRSTLAHELGHQWFAGFIGSDDPYSPWLNEGFATFSEMLYTIAEGSKALGFDYGPFYRSLVAQGYIYTVRTGKDVPMTSQAIYKAPAEVYVAVTYNKGGMVVNMLRVLAGGDAPFFAALQQYRKEHASKKATAESLRASLEVSTGKDLTCFMTRWVQSPGYPTFTVDVKRSAGGSEITILSDRETCLPLELELATADGKTERRPLSLTGVKATLTVKGAELVGVRLDPDHQLIRRVLGALPGDLQIDGEVDGIDLIYAAWAQGRSFDPKHGTSIFPSWADLVFDGSIDTKDLEPVLEGFAKGGQP